MAGKIQHPKETRIDSDVSKPSTTAPGDGPHDTTDPLERASSVRPDKAAAAQAGFGTVNAVVPLPAADKLTAPKGEDRIEKYDTIGPDGKKVTVTHNIDTGETSV